MAIAEFEAGSYPIEIVAAIEAFLKARPDIEYVGVDKHGSIVMYKKKEL